MTVGAQIERHYGRGDLVAAIRDALVRAGKDPDHLSVEDLSAIDQMHVRGREATRELAQCAGLKPGLRVLDIGSGIGGPSRLLAAEFGCHVTGLDLTAEYCRAAAAIAAWVGLSDRLEYQQGDALAMPFPDAGFDVVWTQHAAMNIPDKARLYAEAARVVKSGGLFALYDVTQGPAGSLHFPVPWASDPSISFLVASSELRRLLEQAGFRVESWRDTTEEARAWAARMDQRLSAAPLPPLAGTVIHGPDFAERARNLRRNLAEDRIALIEAVCRRD